MSTYTASAGRLETDHAWIIRAVLVAGVAIAVIAFGGLRRPGAAPRDPATAR
jgi:hypothetical protein